jgi:predicted transcriptional regulator
MASRKLNRRERLRIKAQIADLYCQNYSQDAIAQTLRVTTQMVSYYWRKIEAGWQKKTLEDAGEILGRQLAKLALVQKEGWEGWKRSRKEAKTTSKKAKIKPSAGKGKGKGKDRTTEVESAEKREQRVGDPRFLAIVMDAVKDENKILGVYAPEKLDALMREESGVLVVPTRFDDLETWEKFFKQIPQQEDPDAIINDSETP